jgi:hypothetical protein
MLVIVMTVFLSKIVSCLAVFLLIARRIVIPPKIGGFYPSPANRGDRNTCPILNNNSWLLGVGAKIIDRKIYISPDIHDCARSQGSNYFGLELTETSVRQDSLGRSIG